MRTFIALDLQEEDREAIKELIYRFKPFYSKEVKWVEPQNLHVTIQFIGDIDKKKSKEIADSLSGLSTSKPFFLKSPQIEFEPRSKPRILWLRFSENTELKSFVASIRKNLKDLDCKFDKKDFLPHVTLGRIKTQLPKPIVNSTLSQKINLENIVLRNLTLYESVLKKEGPVYKTISSFLLEGEI